MNLKSKDISPLGLFLAVCGCIGLQGCGQKTLTAQEVKLAVDSCFATGGKPTPVYDKDDPTLVYRVDCPRPEGKA